MPEFLTLLPPAEALRRLLDALPPVSVVSEIIDSTLAMGRVTSAPVYAPYPLPTFPRSTVDGYAVRAADTYGASETLPIYLGISGEILMGSAANLLLEPCHCALIHTGGMLPEQADAVVMVEYTQLSHTGETEILRPVAVGENTIQIGEDVKAGEEVIHAGIRLRPEEIGGLVALGLSQVSVVPKPKIGIISTGDEIVAPNIELKPGQVYDINTSTLSAVILGCGGEPIRYGIIPDREEALHAAASKALAECTVVVITAGSSASTRDLTAQVIQELGQPGVLVHGVNIRPGKPVILAICNAKAVIGLPGNPVSALVAARLFVVPVVESLLRLHLSSVFNPRNISPSIRARLTINVSSQAGREDWIPVWVTETPSGIMAEPLFGKSNLIFTLVHATGMVRIPPDVTGLPAGETVEVIIF